MHRGGIDNMLSSETSVPPGWRDGSTSQRRRCFSCLWRKESAQDVDVGMGSSEERG